MTPSAGGTTAIRVAVDLFYQRVLADPGLAPWFQGVDMAAQRAHQRAFLVAALGGPELYQGRDLTSAHAGLGIDDAAFDRAVLHLVLSLREAGVAEDSISRISRQLEPMRRRIVERRA